MTNSYCAAILIAYVLGYLQGKSSKFYDFVWFYIMMCLYFGNFAISLTGSVSAIFATIYLTICAINTYNWNKQASTFLMIDQYTAI